MSGASANDRFPDDRSVPEMTVDATSRTIGLRADPFLIESDTPPEQRLMIALLSDAIRCVRKYRNASDYRGKRLFQVDREWILSDDSSWIHAFSRICETLDLEPMAVRRALGLVPEGGGRVPTTWSLQ